MALDQHFVLADASTMEVVFHQSIPSLYTRLFALHRSLPPQGQRALEAFLATTSTNHVIQHAGLALLSLLSSYKERLN